MYHIHRWQSWLHIDIYQQEMTQWMLSSVSTSCAKEDENERQLALYGSPAGKMAGGKKQLLEPRANKKKNNKKTIFINYRTSSSYLMKIFELKRYRVHFEKFNFIKWKVKASPILHIYGSLHAPFALLIFNPISFYLLSPNKWQLSKCSIFNWSLKSLSSILKY